MLLCVVISFHDVQKYFPAVGVAQWICASLRRVWRYQRGNQNPYIEEEQTTQWPKEKVQKDKLKRSTKHTYKTKDRVTRTPLKTYEVSEVTCKAFQLTWTCNYMIMDIYVMHLKWIKKNVFSQFWHYPIV